MKWRIRGTFIDAQNIQPLLYQLVLPVGDGLINADGIKVTGENNVAYRCTYPVIQMQAAADIANMFLISQIVSPLPRRRPNRVRSLLYPRDDRR